MKKMLSTKEVAGFLGVNEKMVYSLISEKGLPATKITGKWLFPLHLVEQWVENNAVNHPGAAVELPPYEGLLIIAGSNDWLLEKAITLFNSRHEDHLAVFGNLGSTGGLSALRRRICHIATSHLLQDDERDYNFAFASETFDRMPVVVNFCRREQGILVARDNPLAITGVADLAKPGVRIVNRPLGTGTRLLFDRELAKAEIRGERLTGYDVEMARHLDVGLEILAGRADAAPCIRPVAGILGLDFVPIRWERYDLLLHKDRFFDQGVQAFLGLLHDKAFLELARSLSGYDVEASGQMVFQQ